MNSTEYETLNERTLEVENPTFDIESVAGRGSADLLTATAALREQTFSETKAGKLTGVYKRHVEVDSSFLPHTCLSVS